MSYDIFKNITGALIASGVGVGVAWWRWRQDGRDQFHAATSDMRAKLEMLQESPEKFIIASIPILRSAIYRVRPFARDWIGLHRAWQDYEISFEHKDADRTAFHLRLKECNDNNTACKILEDFLDQFDAHVSNITPSLHLRIQTLRGVRLSGCKRLGFVCSLFWMLLSITIYFFGIYLYPSPLTNGLSKLYMWIDGKLITNDLVTLSPTPDLGKLSLVVFLPIFVGWTTLWLIPCSIRWVIDGFRVKATNDSGVKVDQFKK